MGGTGEHSFGGKAGAKLRSGGGNGVCPVIGTEFLGALQEGAEAPLLFGEALLPLCQRIHSLAYQLLLQELLAGYAFKLRPECSDPVLISLLNTNLSRLGRGENLIS